MGKAAVVDGTSTTGRCHVLDPKDAGAACKRASAALDSAAVSIMAPPGQAGSAMAAAVAERRGFHQVSLDALLQGAVARGDDALNEALVKGHLTPAAKVHALVDDAIAAANGRGVVLVGYPRTVEEARAFESRHGALRVAVNLGAATPSPAAEAEGGERSQDEKTELSNENAGPLLDHFAGKGQLHSASGSVSAEALCSTLPALKLTLVAVAGDEDGCGAKRLGDDGNFRVVDACAVLGGTDTASATSATVAAEKLRRHILSYGGSRFAITGFPVSAASGGKPYPHEQDIAVEDCLAKIQLLLVGKVDNAATQYFDRTGRLRSISDDGAWREICSL